MTKPSIKGADLKVERLSFVTQAGLKSLNDLSAMSEKDMVELCEQFPKAASQLIIDLFTEWGLASAEAAKYKTAHDTLLNRS